MVGCQGLADECGGGRGRLVNRGAVDCNRSLLWGRHGRDRVRSQPRIS